MIECVRLYTIHVCRCARYCLCLFGGSPLSLVGLRSAVGCKPREAVLYPDTVAGANPKVGPYCSSRWSLEGLWLMQRSESSDSRGSAMAPLHAQPQTEGRPDLSTFRCVRYGSARFEGGSVSGVNPKGRLLATADGDRRHGAGVFFNMHPSTSLIGHPRSLARPGDSFWHSLAQGRKKSTKR